MADYNYRKFGRKTKPIRISSLPMLLTCPGFAVLRDMLEDDQAGQAAVDGTTVGRACELWHNGVGVEGALKGSMGENPTATEEFVNDILQWYAIDPRNGPLGSLQVLPEYQEQEVEVKLRGASGWFYLLGHVDQVRVDVDDDGTLWIWDLKAGRMYGGNQMIDCYAAQQALYAIGMSELLGRPVGYGGIIRLRGYIGRTNVKIPVEQRPVFYHARWDLEKCKAFAARMTHTLDDIRRGRVQVAPGGQCCFCPAGGAANCGSMLP
jgi:hypothetical protein